LQLFLIKWEMLSLIIFFRTKLCGSEKILCFFCISNHQI